MITAGNVIKAARDYHPEFTPDRTPDLVLLRFLSQEVRRLTAAALRVHPAFKSAEEVITFPLDDFEAGHPVPAFLYVHGGTVHLQGGVTDEFELIDYSARFGRVPRWSGWIEGSNLKLIGEPSRWNGVLRIVLRYAPMPAAITSSADTIDLPDSAERPLVLACANFMVGRVPRDAAVPIDRAYFLATARDAEREWLAELTTRTRVAVSYTREVW